MDTGFSRLVVLKVRVVSVDFRMVVPDASSDATHLPSTSAGTAAEIEHVPVIRVFGATPMGQNVCLYVHQVSNYPLNARCSCCSLTGLSVFFRAVRGAHRSGPVYDGRSDNVQS